MTSRLQTRNPTRLARKCVVCGCPVARDHATPVLVESCPQCDCDFHVRPPRSYAEMEGFVPLGAGPMAIRPAIRSRRSPSMMHRWIVFIAFVVGGVAGVLALMAALVA
ncbi:MAG: hypothetical protein AB8G96_17390 [Phycisphaerales bacterium]